MGQKVRNDGPKETITTNIDPSGTGKNGPKKGAAVKKPHHQSKYDEEDNEDDHGNYDGGFGSGGAGPVSGQKS